MPAVGERVRVTRSTGSVTIGRFQSATADSMRLRSEDTKREYVIGRRLITNVETSAGRSRRFMRNFGLGLGATAALGGLIGAAKYTECESTVLFGCLWAPKSRMESAGLGLAGGAVLGLPIGIMTGLIAKHDQWKPLMQAPGDALLLISPVPGGRLTLGATIRF